MTLLANRNLYPGVNANLNSYLQGKTGWWESFHADHITLLRMAIDEILPPNYFAASEKSLQISVLEALQEEVRRTRPDLSIYQQAAAPRLPSAIMPVPTAVLPLVELETELEEETMRGIVIYAVQPSGDAQPVTRIELLSPSNKPNGTGWSLYRSKRRDTLRSGIALVEIDYLHESPPVNRLLPAYARQEPAAHPYLLLISVPGAETTAYYGFGVDEAIPPLPLPLAGNEYVFVALGAVYDRTLSSSRAFITFADYSRDPERLHTFTPADQAQIAARLALIRAELNSGRS